MNMGFVKRAWAWAVGRRAVWPEKIGSQPHDCALASLYWAVPWLPESKIVEAFSYCADAWPYSGVTNKEFSIALKYLHLKFNYSDKTETLGEVLNRRPTKAVVLVHGHFISIHKGRIVGHDAMGNWPSEAVVYCCWTFPLRRFRQALA